MDHHYDILIIGTGAAGLGLALSLADHYKIAVVTKGKLKQGSSRWAQGGIAAVLERDEAQIQSHIEDTLNAGQGLCHQDTVELVVKEAKEAIEWLIEQGVQFTTKNGQLHLTQEGGHSTRRILHVKDHTGSAVVKTLADQVEQHKNIRVFREHTAIDLIASEGLDVETSERLGVTGAIILNNKTGKVENFFASKTVLATGGASSCYLHTTNPDNNYGDGIAMAYRAGCRVANLEFEQFHPTSLFHPDANSFLISEAVRGEGGKLRLSSESPDVRTPERQLEFMLQYDPRGELAPRDIVSRAIDSEMKKHGLTHVNLDISHLPEQQIKDLFPTIYERCLSFGIDMTKQAIPVVPAAHYTCGGVMSDLNGCTDLDNLYAIGEVTFTGLHGANRMASNSLLECLVFARRAAQHIKRNDVTTDRRDTVKKINSTSIKQKNNTQHPTSNIQQQIKELLWQKVGIVRTTKDLQDALTKITTLKKQADDIFAQQEITEATIDLRNLALVAELIIQSALMRKESRGLHYNLDYPEKLDSLSDTVLKAENTH